MVNIDSCPTSSQSIGCHFLPSHFLPDTHASSCSLRGFLSQFFFLFFFNGIDFSKFLSLCGKSKVKVSKLFLTPSASWEEDTMQGLQSGKLPRPLSTATLDRGAPGERRILLPSLSQPRSLHTTKGCAMLFTKHALQKAAAFCI